MKRSEKQISLPGAESTTKRSLSVWLVAALALTVALCFGMNTIVDQIGNASLIAKKFKAKTEPVMVSDVKGLGGLYTGGGRDVATDTGLYKGIVRPVNGGIDLRGSKLSSQAIDFMLHMKGIEHIDLDEATLSDKDFAKILDSGIPSIYARGVDSLTDAALSHLKTSKLWRLGLASDQMTSKGYELIADTPSIYDLTLEGAKTFTDADLDYLSRHSHGMKTLDISLTSVTGKNLACLQRMQHLVSVKMSGLAVTDESLVSLIPIKLIDLELSHTKISDAALDSISKIQTLQNLNVECCTNLTEAGLDMLEKRLPNCHLNHRDASILLLDK